MRKPREKKTDAANAIRSTNICINKGVVDRVEFDIYHGVFIRKDMIKLPHFASLFLILVAANLGFAQEKSAKLKKFSPLLGLYAYTMDYEDYHWNGWLEIKKSPDSSTLEVRMLHKSEKSTAQWTITWNT